MGITERRQHRENMKKLRNDRRNQTLTIRQEHKDKRTETRQKHKDNRAETRHQQDWMWPLVVGGVAIAGLMMVVK